MKFPVLKRKYYTIYFEYGTFEDTEVIFAHADVYKWNKEVKEEFKQACTVLFVIQELPVFVGCDKDNIKLKKFVKLNNFKLYCDDVEVEDGSHKELYIWRQQNG